MSDKIKPVSIRTTARVKKSILAVSGIRKGGRIQKNRDDSTKTSPIFPILFDFFIILILDLFCQF